MASIATARFVAGRLPRRRWGWNCSFSSASSPSPLPMVEDAQILVSDRTIDPFHLQQLMSHTALAVHVKGFYPKELAQTLGKKISKEAIQDGQARNWTVGSNMESTDVLTVGAHVPYNVAHARGEIDAYFQGVQRELKQRRHENPCIWPLDQLRLELDEAWPGGAGLARDAMTGRPFGGGLPRIMVGPTRWRDGFVHCDQMGPLMPWQGLFSGNIYLQMPESSGSGPQEALEIWNLAIRSEEDWNKHAKFMSLLASQDAEDQMELRYRLGKPSIVSVEPGDLILLCVQRPHAAVGFSSRGSVRVSLQCFLRHTGSHERLLIDS